MRRSPTLLVLLALALATLLVANSAEARYWHTKAAAKEKKKPEAAEAKKPKLKPFGEVSKGFNKIPGLFDFYFDKDENKVLMAVKKDQLNKLFLCNMTRSAGDGSYFDAGAQTGYFPFELRRIGDQLQFLVANLRIRADSTAPMARAIGRSISYSIYGSTKILSNPDTAGAFLIDPTEIFVQDVPNVGYFLGQQGRTGHRFDKGNSFFGTIKSFPQNSELDVVLHYATNQPSDAETAASPYSMLLTYHYSLSTIPESDFRPRVADERVGYFMTQHQDYTSLDQDQAYIRYINRWQLKKKDPAAAVSEPVEPIVFWIENTTPVEYRAAVKAGIEFWQGAFEKAGFKNAIIAKEMPDTADWDPADVRFSTVRWFVSPGAGYAVGPSRANPFTGQIYDADVRISADFVRGMFTYAEKFLEPLAFGQSESEDFPRNPGDDVWNHNHFGEICDYGPKSAKVAAEGMAVLALRNTLDGKSELTKKYVNEYITELVAHEVGHCLGLRHNFKASTVFPRAQQTDVNFVEQNGVVSTVMEYAPPNLVPDGMKQPDFYTTKPGPYDLWAIEYGYKDFGNVSPDQEGAELRKLASQAGDPKLVYATDEDCFGNSTRAIDPYATQFDLGADPLEYWKMRVALGKEIWSKVESEFEKPGNNYQKLRSVFQYGWGGFTGGAAQMARFIGGIENSRARVGDSGGKLPFTPIPAAQQREAMKFIIDNVWSADAFQFSPRLLQKLQPERMPDFNWSVYEMTRLDYPLLQQVKAVQSTPLNYIYNPITLARVGDMERLVGTGGDVYTMTDIFQDVRRAIWSEVTANRNINSYRRNLQRSHLDRLVAMVTDRNMGFPDDAVTLARVDLRTLRTAIGNALNAGSLDTITRGHLEESLATINAALDASLDLKL
ncbi:MAG: zinc-dependent metalloprotease [candidate division Zixibacteria bacterium]|nr:zinc-dependent metalloprotease [candidate division Zixibacteria bacterium]